MADNIDRTHVYNVMDWIEAEQDEKNRGSKISQLAAEIAILRRDVRSSCPHWIYQCTKLRYPSMLYGKGNGFPVLQVILYRLEDRTDAVRNIGLPSR